MTIHKAKTNSYTNVNVDSLTRYIKEYSQKIKDDVNDSYYNGKLQKANKNQIKAIAAELETVCKRLGWILEGRY